MFPMPKNYKHIPDLGKVILREYRRYLYFRGMRSRHLGSINCLGSYSQSEELYEIHAHRGAASTAAHHRVDVAYVTIGRSVPLAPGCPHWNDLFRYLLRLSQRHQMAFQWHITLDPDSNHCFKRRKRSLAGDAQFFDKVRELRGVTDEFRSGLRR
jgi:hypothetical protein